MASEISRARSALKKFALALPDAYEDFQWGERVAKVGKKVFVFFGREGAGAGLSFSVKLPVSGQDALDLPFTEPTGYGLGKHDWVNVRFSPGEDAPVDLLRSWIEESYRAVAPKKLLAKLDGSRSRGWVTRSPMPRGRLGRRRSAPR